jgi:hypothetical protein
MRASRSVIAAIPGIAVLVGSAAPAAADIRGPRWADTAHTLRQGDRSNEVGFWKTFLHATRWPCYGNHSGIFGSATKSVTQWFQSTFLGLPADGVVGWQTWNKTQDLTYVQGGQEYKRLVHHGGPYWSYYGGLATSAQLVWGGGGNDIWKFQQYQGGSPYSGIWSAATTAHTMPSTGC